MLFRTDLLNEFDRLTKGLNLGPEFTTTLDRAFNGSNIDIVRSSERFEVYIDLPGVDPDAVELAVDGRTVTVCATREFTPAEGDEHVHAGRRHGTFHRSFSLADDLDADALTARSEHGVLIISVPVIAAPEPRKVTITTES